MRVVVTGSTGMIGAALRERLTASGHEVVPLLRGPRMEGAGWNPAEGWIAEGALERSDAIVHLAGASIGRGRWTAQRKALLRASRIDSARLLIDELERTRARPAVLVSASAVGYYGDRGDEVLDEDSPPGRGFLAELVREWEAAARQAEPLGLRVVTPRFGVVMARRDAALARMLLPFRLGLGGRIGSGRQWMSWVALEDVTRAIEFLLVEPLRGAVNVTAPAPVTNAEFTRALARAVRRPAVLRVPPFALRALYGRGPVDELLLASQRVMPTRLLGAGFRFTHPEVHGALEAALRPRRAQQVPAR